MKGAAVLAPEGRGDALLAFEDASQAGPAFALALLAKAPTDRLQAGAFDRLGGGLKAEGRKVTETIRAALRSRWTG